jgi:hypothetical protein
MSPPRERTPNIPTPEIPLDRRHGPVEPLSVRSDGDPAFARMLADAIAQSGGIERATHGFHTYPAGMHPDTAALVIDACPGPVHDPFCGGGTVLVEAMLAGRPSSGTDLSAVALLVAAARTSPNAGATALRSASRRITEAARQRVDVPVPPICVEWYEPHVAQELGRLLQGIKAAPVEAQPLLEAVFSAIAVKSSFRESDTSNRRKTGHRPPGTTAILFHKKARELGRALDALPVDAPRPRLRMADARTFGPPAGTGLILTSPPYPGVYDYLPMQQLRIAWLGLDAAAGMAAEVGSRRDFRARGRTLALSRWREDTSRWTATQALGLAPGGRMAVVVGDGLVGGKLVETLGPTIEGMRAAGLRIVARASADRPDHAREAIRTEHLVLAERPGG